MKFGIPNLLENLLNLGTDCEIYLELNLELVKISLKSITKECQ